MALLSHEIPDLLDPTPGNRHKQDSQDHHHHLEPCGGIIRERRQGAEEKGEEDYVNLHFVTSPIFSFAAS